MSVCYGATSAVKSKQQVVNIHAATLLTMWAHAVKKSVARDLYTPLVCVYGSREKSWRAGGGSRKFWCDLYTPLGGGGGGL